MLGWSRLLGAAVSAMVIVAAALTGSSVLAASSPSVSATVTVGTDPTGVAVSPSGSYAYVANYTGNSVSVIDTSTNTVTATVSVGTYPLGVAFTPSGSYAYVANFGSNTVSVIDTSTNTVTTTVTVGLGPRAVAVSPDGSYAYVSNYFSGSVSVIATGLGASSGGGSTRAVPQVVSVDLDLEAAELPASWSQSATIGSWYQLPASADVVGVGENAGKTFLGVATREDFPVAIAQRQVDNGWGAYETYDANGRLASVFIPAGKSLHLTAAPRLHAIWSQ